MSSSNLRPTCRTCGKPLVLVDGEKQRWYCYEDDALYYGKEARWVESKHVRIRPLIPLPREYRLRRCLASNIRASALILCLACLLSINEVGREDELWYLWLRFALGVAILVAGMLLAFRVSNTMPENARISPMKPSLLWLPFHKPFDKYGIALTTWTILALVCLLLTATYWILSLVH